MKILIDENEISQRVESLAALISKDYENETLDVVCFLNGASIFCSDLIRKLTIPVRLHYFGFNSFKNPSNYGDVQITYDIHDSIAGKHILVIEGLVITGKTPRYLLDYFLTRKPASLEICALGLKPKFFSNSFQLKYCGFEFESENVVGYGIGSSENKALPFLIDSNNI